MQKEQQQASDEVQKCFIDTKKYMEQIGNDLKQIEEAKRELLKIREMLNEDIDEHNMG